MYADDIIIFAKDLDHCLKLLNEVLSCLRRDGYVVSASKCSLFKKELNILGQIVGNGIVQIDKGRIENMLNLPVPSTKKGL